MGQSNGVLLKEVAAFRGFTVYLQYEYNNVLIHTYVHM